MPPTLRDVRTALAERAERERATVAGEPSQRALLAAVSAEKLLGDPNWDRYLMRLQALLNEVKTARTMWAERCTGAVSLDDVRVAQLNFHACDARMKTLVEVMEIPTALMDEVKDASSRPSGPEPA